MNMKKIVTLILTLMMVSGLALTASAMEQGAYQVYAATNYWNPDTGEIDDGGTANAALGEGMCRSATDTRALVEFDGTNYYVTIRLLLQSNTKEAIFWAHTGYNSYEEVSYEILAENAVEDSIDYRFSVEDPFAPIKASMYVTPMGRSTVWYIELDASSLSADTGDFVVTVTAAPQLEEVLVEETPVEETPVEEMDRLEEIAEEVISEAEQPEEQILDSKTAEVETSEDALQLESEVEAEVESEVEAEVEPEITADEVVDELVTEEPQSNGMVYVAGALVVLVVVGMFLLKKKHSK